MKRLLLLISLIINVSNCRATQQIPDFLIIGKDTFKIFSFPLEVLKIEKAPFYYRGGWGFPHTGCYRGYQATWKIVDSKLFLVHVTKVDSTNEKLDIVKYLSENNHPPTVINGLIFADWYSAKFRYCERWFYNYRNCMYAPNEKVLFPILIIKNGAIIKNNMYEP
jgi:hypothetical protein